MVRVQERFAAAKPAVTVEESEPEPEPEPGDGEGSANNGASSTSSKAAAKDGYWKEMTAAEQAAAVILGWTAEMWDSGETPAAVETRWEALSQEEQTAAELMGAPFLLWHSCTHSSLSHFCTTPPFRIAPLWRLTS